MLSANLYQPIFLYSVIFLTFASWSTVRNSYFEIRKGNKDFAFSIFICIVFALWVGERPISAVFGDTVNYAHSYSLMKHGVAVPTDSGEWIWNQFMYWCAQIMEVNSFFTIIEIAYFGFTLWACKRLTNNNPLISMLFMMASFSFFSYGTNGLRNGLACSIVLLFLSYICGNKKDKIIAGCLAFVAFNIHHTTILPIAMAVASLLFIRDFKTAYTFWILSIIISLVAGGAVTAMFAGLGFDDRLSYLSSNLEEGKFSKSGFRWDFLIYSMMPIVLGYYIVIKRNIQDRTYSILLNTYTLANAFWVMVIRANFSNRFAYLSWFMYPIVLAYPLLKLDIWGDMQGTRLKQIMLAHVGFTWFMFTFYW